MACTRSYAFGGGDLAKAEWKNPDYVMTKDDNEAMERHLKARTTRPGVGGQQFSFYAEEAEALRHYCKFVDPDFVHCRAQVPAKGRHGPDGQGGIRLYERGFSALHVCAKYGSPECTKVLIECGADINVVTGPELCCTPIVSAMAGMNVPNMEVLKEAGANLLPLQAELPVWLRTVGMSKEYTGSYEAQDHIFRIVGESKRETLARTNPAQAALQAAYPENLEDWKPHIVGDVLKKIVKAREEKEQAQKSLKNGEEQLVDRDDVQM